MIAFPCLIHCCFATFRVRLSSEPGTTTFCVFVSTLHLQCWNHTTIFQETSNLYHILEPIIGGLYQKLFSDVHFGAVSLIHSASQRNAARFWAFSFQSCDRLLSLFILFFFFFSSRSFLIFIVTSDWVLNQLRIPIFQISMESKWTAAFCRKILFH